MTEINARAKLLKELVRESHYVVEPQAVAEAIVLRMMARRVLPDVAFRSAPIAAHVRSFRPHRGARSFRLSNRGRRPTHRLSGEPGFVDAR